MAGFLNPQCNDFFSLLNRPVGMIGVDRNVVRVLKRRAAFRKLFDKVPRVAKND